MKKLGPHARSALERIDHPPAADQMQDVMHGLAWDGDIARIERLASVMVSHYNHLPSTHSSRDYNEFYYWLGVRGVAMSMMNARRERLTAKGRIRIK